MAKKKEKPKEEKKILLKQKPNKIKKIGIKIIGIGGGGCSIIGEISKRINKVSFVAVNTDLQALKGLPKNIKRFSFGEEVTGGLGTGMNVKLAESLAEKEKEKIKNLYKNQDICIFISTLGGGTGSGAGPVFIKEAESFPCVKLGIFTLPFKFEGKKRLQIAKEALKKITPLLNASLIIPNDRIFQLVNKNISLRKALIALDKILAENLKEIIDLILNPGIINIDFADFKTILEEKGNLFFLNTLKTSGANRVEKIINNIFHSPLSDFNFGKIEGILFNLAGSGELKVEEVNKISKTISSLNKGAKIIFGISKDKNLKEERKGDKIKLTLFVVGKEKEEKGKQKKKAKIKKEKKEKKVKKSKKKKKRKEVKKEALKEKKSLEIKNQKKRKTALEIKKALEEEEKKLLEKEKEWEIPTFIRKGFKKKIKIVQKK